MNVFAFLAAIETLIYLFRSEKILISKKIIDSFYRIPSFDLFSVNFSCKKQPKTVFHLCPLVLPLKVILFHFSFPLIIYLKKTNRKKTDDLRVHRCVAWRTRCGIYFIFFLVQI